ncbi:MAG TPA: hypothetical protein VJI75_02915, partial [Candidatus Nanoarchaeia archaeon]|nr:hypothetical protein [Candidatus Nanoarchaeia archaeon]
AYLASNCSPQVSKDCYTKQQAKSGHTNESKDMAKHSESHQRIMQHSKLFISMSLIGCHG